MDALTEFQQQVYSLAELGVWAGVGVGCILVFVAGILAVKAVW